MTKRRRFDYRTARFPKNLPFVICHSMRCQSDYHTHPQGHTVRPYSIELLQPWIDRCREREIKSIAFTDHDRYHDGIDFDAVERLRERNPDAEILMGIELDNDPVTG